MTEWKPIETAPRDGTILLITDGILFASAIPYDYHEPDEIGYNNPIDFGGDTRRPNPEAGKIKLLWHSFGCSAFKQEAMTYDGEYNCPLSIEPTHWVPLLEPPK